eukprot:1158006-Pelagomonas_calceolata.AAC.3
MGLFNPDMQPMSAKLAGAPGLLLIEPTQLLKVSWTSDVLIKGVSHCLTGKNMKHLGACHVLLNASSVLSSAIWGFSCRVSIACEVKGMSTSPMCLLCRVVCHKSLLRIKGLVSPTHNKSPFNFLVAHAFAVLALFCPPLHSKPHLTF